MATALELVRDVYDALDRLFSPLYRFSGIVAGLALVVMLLLTPSLVDGFTRFAVPVVPAAGVPMVVAFVVAAAVFVVFTLLETLTGLVAVSAAAMRWLLDRAGAE